MPVFLLEKRKAADEPFLTTHRITKDLLNRDSPASERTSGKMAAISPMIVNTDLFGNTGHAIAGHVSNVRMLHSITLPKDKSEKSRNIRDGRKILKSDAYMVIPAGSVFYLKENERLPASDERLPEKIGYNLMFAG